MYFDAEMQVLGFFSPPGGLNKYAKHLHIVQKLISQCHL